MSRSARLRATVLSCHVVGDDLNVALQLEPGQEIESDMLLRADDGRVFRVGGLGYGCSPEAMEAGIRLVSMEAVDPPGAVPTEGTVLSLVEE
jgi:hypothetical protein